ncbi:hypothetical protein Tco_0091179 [Tanacetum coccineum]
MITNSSKVPVNTAKQSFPRAAVSNSTARYVNTATSKPTMNGAKPSSNVFHKSHSPVRRTFNQKAAPKNSILKEKVNTTKVNNVTTAGPKAVISVVQGHEAHAVKASVDETVHQVRGDSVERAATTATSLEAVQDSIVPGAKRPWEVPLLKLGLRGHLNCPMIHHSEEVRLKLNELMKTCTELSDMVLALEKVKTAQAKEIADLKKRERNDEDLMYETGVYDYPEGFIGPSVSITTAEPVTTAGEGVCTARAIPEEVSTATPEMDVTLTEALVDLLKSGKTKSSKPKARSISF